MFQMNRIQQTVLIEAKSQSSELMFEGLEAAFTSRMAAQNLLCKTLCRAWSLGGGSSPLL